MRVVLDTDALLVDFTDRKIVDTRNLNEDILAELNKNGHLVSMTAEHAKQQTNVSESSCQRAAG